MSSLSIVNRGDWLGSPANIKGTNKDFKIYVGRSTTVHNLLFCPHTLCMNYVTNTFLLVSSSVRSKQLLLCFVHGQGQKKVQKHNHSPLLTMISSQSWSNIELRVKVQRFLAQTMWAVIGLLKSLCWNVLATTRKAKNLKLLFYKRQG